MNWFEKQMKKLGYKGCRNCKHQIDVLRTCEWMEHGGDGVLHLICPKWEKREASEQLVQNGRWVAVENDLDYYPFMCSECYETVIKRTNRCPKCGARMEAKENEND